MRLQTRLAISLHDAYEGIARRRARATGRTGGRVATRRRGNHPLAHHRLKGVDSVAA